MTLVQLPDDVINYILDYGDPRINQKYNFVLIQLKYLNNEFNYNRKKKYNTWYGYEENEFKHYILYKNNSKSSLNYCHVLCNHTYCNLHH
jgi:hypothetical protein